MARHETHSSIWLIDEDAQVVSRFPKTENPTHDFAPYEYVGAPERYKTLEYVEVCDATCVQITMPDGRWIRSGAILG